MPRLLEVVSDALPLSYAVDAMTSVSTTAGSGFAGVDPGVWSDIVVVLAFTVGGLVLGAGTLRRRTA
jgi:ABC-2 type transport system permease protein